ncbi:uncharacterized protein LOC142519646 [Primulina tabacum]|uniref:uncharacterized protein LOC142519646 n=1 Tax=Primulina tabacum TaxID=48773 RepID=UPI003F590232
MIFEAKEKKTVAAHGRYSYYSGGGLHYIGRNMRYNRESMAKRPENHYLRRSSHFWSVNGERRNDPQLVQKIIQRPAPLGADRKYERKPRFVVPPRAIPDGVWKRVEHPKLPKPLSRTQKRHLLREKAVERRSGMEESFKEKKNFGRKATKDNEEEDDDLLSEEDSEPVKRATFKVGIHSDDTLNESVGVLVDEEKRVLMKRPTSEMTKHIKPLYIIAHVNGKPLSRVLIDNGSAVNILPYRIFQKLGKNVEDLIPTEVSVAAFTGESTKTLGVLPANVTVGSRSSLSAFFLLLMWKGDEVEVVQADSQPYQSSSNAVEARYYDGAFGPIKIRNYKVNGQQGAVYMDTKKVREAVEKILKPTAMVSPRPMVQPIIEEELWDIDGTEIIFEDEWDNSEETELQLEDIVLALAQMEDWQPETQDPLKEVNLGTVECPKPTYISDLLEEEKKGEIVKLLIEFKDCFVWEYEDMPGLDCKLVEHRLPIKDGFKPYQQPARRMSKEIEARVKEEIEKLLKAKFIRPVRYTKWLANIVHVMKKNGKLQVCIDFRDLNCATPKDVYVMPVADMLVDAVANNELMSFMDGFSGYNQIKIAEEDVSKTAFRCPGAIGTFEWLVMPFGLKNAGATYQRRGISLVFWLSRGGQNKAKAIMAAMPPKTKKELQRFLGQTDLVKYMLHRPILTGRIDKWSLALAKFTLIYCPQKSMKGQDVADFLADHPMVDVTGSTPVDIPVFCVSQSWTLKFDGSSTEKASGVGVVITSPMGIKTTLLFNLDFSCTNNQAEYETLVIGLEILRDLGAKDVLIIGDSQLVLKQMSGEYKCSSLVLAPYFTAASQLLDDFEDVTFQHMPRQDNWEADELAQIASGLRMSPELTHTLLLVQKRNHPSIYQLGIQVDTFDIDVELAGYWRDEINDALRNPEHNLHYGLKMRVLHYVLVEDELYRKGDDGLLLRCLGFPEAMRCQKHGNIQRIPADEMHAVIKPWPFHGWAMDLIGKVYPPSSKGHSFIIVATDFFTKWVEALPMKKVEHKDVIVFV